MLLLYFFLSKRVGIDKKCTVLYHHAVSCHFGTARTTAVIFFFFFTMRQKSNIKSILMIFFYSVHFGNKRDIILENIT